MIAYVLRRLVQSVLVLLGVSVIVFGLLHLTGDPTRLLLPLEAREEDVRRLRALLGLDDPLWLQYLRYCSASTTRSGCSTSGSWATPSAVTSGCPSSTSC